MISLPLLAQRGPGQSQSAAAEQLFAMANHARSLAGAPPLQWDAALAAAAMKHCRRMVTEGPISHRYAGESDLSERASAAGSHFSLIEENIAIGSYARQIHDGWMNSPGHRSNLLNREVDHVGIAVIATGDTLYAVADYTRGVMVMAPAQIESKVGELIRMSGVTVRKDSHDARAACAVEHGFPSGAAGAEPGFVMRWQSADLDHLPQPLVDRLGSRQYHQAAVGSCAPRSGQAAFTQYRVAVLLY